MKLSNLTGHVLSMRDGHNLQFCNYWTFGYCRSFFIGEMAIEFVDKQPHLGHIILATRDDKADIMSKRNTLCQHINNVLCFFASHDPITKLKLLKAYCNSFYGSVLWDLTMTNASIRDVCIAWRKGLRRIWDLPHNTHCNLLPLLCDTLPLMDELSCRCATFYYERS